jgi:hypothetical protein
MEMRTFTEFWKGMFFFVATAGLAIILYLVVVVWQPLWTEGFSNFGDISKAISRLDRTAKPVGEIAPMILGEMDEMRVIMKKMQQSMETLEELNPSIKEMNYNVHRMSWVMERQMGEMTNEMDRMGDKFSPTGMMPLNW